MQIIFETFVLSSRYRNIDEPRARTTDIYNTITDRMSYAQIAVETAEFDLRATSAPFIDNVIVISDSDL